MRPILRTAFDPVMDGERDRLYRQEKLSHEGCYHMNFPTYKGGNKYNIHSVKKCR